MSERIILRTGEALVEGDADYLCAEPEIVIGELDGLALPTSSGRAKGSFYFTNTLGRIVKIDY